MTLLKLPTVVDKALLIQESGLFPFCPPFMPNQVCRAHIGSQEVLQDTLRDSQSGDGFLCVADAAPTAAVVNPAALPHARHVHHLFGSLAAFISNLVHATCRLAPVTGSWDTQIKTLELQMLKAERDIVNDIMSLATLQAQVTSLLDEPYSLFRSVHESGPSEGFLDFACRQVHSTTATATVRSLRHLLFAKAHNGSPAQCSLQVRVWFSDHLRPHAHEEVPVVTLPQEWQGELKVLLQPWLSHLDLGAEIDLCLVQSRGLFSDVEVDAQVVLLQNPIPHLSSVLMALFESGTVHAPPICRLALVAEPITPETLQHAVRTWFGDIFVDSAWMFDFLWGSQPLTAVGPPGLHHGECFGVLPRLSQEHWVGLNDAQFATMLRNAFPIPPALDISPAVSALVPISLEACVPLHNVDPASQTFDDSLPAIAIAEQASWKQCIYDQELPLLCDLPDGMTIPPATYWALVDPTPLDTAVPSWAELYVDGSTSATTAAWSVVVVRTNGSASRLIGSLYGQVSLAPSCLEWIGAESADNIAAEFTAFATALDLACRMVPVQSVVRPDLKLSALLAAQQCVTEAHPKLAQLISVLAGWMPSGTAITEVRGHTAHPWNELADALAKWALRNSPPRYHSVPVLHQLVSVGVDLHWAWIQGAPASLYQALPPVKDHQVCQFPLSLRKLGRVTPAAEEETGHSRCEVQVFSLNVLALDSLNQQRTHGRQRGQRTARLDVLWHQAGVHIVGLQEARTMAGRHVTDHYMIFASGFEDPTAPRFGCEIWLHRTLPFVVLPDGSKLAAPDFHFVVTHADPRRLFLRAEHSCCSFLVVVLHAPCLGKTKGNGHRPIDDIAAWWQETSRLFEACSHTTFQWICVDANAPLASHETSCFALAHAEASNPQGALFEEFLLNHDFAVPATFPGIQVGESWTWTHSSGSRCRRDYVLVPLAQLSCTQDAFTMSSYDGSFCHEDHIPTGLRFAAFLPGGHTKGRRKWNEIAFLDPIRVAQFQDALRTLPLPTWEVRTSDHCALFEEQLVQLGQQFFGGHPRKRARPQLSAQTLSLIAFKRHILDLGRLWNLMTDDTYKAELRAIEKVVRQAVHQDLTAFYDQLLVRLQSADQAADAKQMFRILDRLGRKRAKAGGPRPLPMLRTSDGQCLQSFQQQQQTWLRQFAEVEAGVPMTWSALFALCRPGLTCLDFEFDPEAFVSPWQLLQAMRKLRRGKACGPNAIPPDLIKAGGAPFAMQLSCLTNKVVAHAHEPTTWRGGKLVPLYKGKGSPHDPLSFRSIFISDFTAKLYHACLRKPLEKVWSIGLHSMQFGGRAGCGVDLPHHFLQMHMCWARHLKKPAAVVFFDLKAAFYSVLRQALTSCPDRTNAFHYAMHCLGLAEHEVDDILQAVAAESAVEGVSTHVEKLVHDTMTGTFFTVEGINTPVATHKGTRPGDPIGDLLFNLTMSRILAEMKQIVIDEEVAEWFGSPARCENFLEPIDLPHVGFADVSFVDDCAVAIHAADLTQLQTVAKSVVSAMHVAARRRGSHLNFESGKTEMLWQVQGKGSRQVKHQLMQEGQMLRWRAFDIDFSLRVVQSYKHLGTWIQSGGCFTREIQTRAQGAKASWGSLAKSFFAKSYVSMPTKLKVFRALALSRHMFNVHTWSDIRPAELDKWANSIRQPICSLAKSVTKGFPPRLFDVVTLSGLIGLESPFDRLHAARLRYFARLLKQCPASLWSLIWHTMHVDGTWGAHLLDSFAWFCRFYGPGWKLSPQSSLEHWILAIQTDGSWKGRVKAALRNSCNYRRAHAEHALWQRSFDRDFYADTGTSPFAPEHDDSRWQCDQCDKWFASKKALATHSQRVHGYRRLVRFFASGDTCPACCKLHHCRMRLCQHLTHSSSCMEILQACFLPMSDAQVEQLDRLDDLVTADLKKQGWWRTKALLPACQAAGPLLPPANSGHARVLLAKCMERYPESGTAFRQLQGRLVDVAPPEPAPEVQIDPLAQGYVFQSAGGSLDGSGMFLYDGLPALNARMNIRTRVFVHFFSGFRRRNDLHDIIAHHVFSDGSQMFALSVDMCLQKAAGDLASSASLAFWRDQVLSGRILGAGGGPPCETFTSARMYGDGPRMVRSEEELAGLPYLTAAEWRQVVIGTRLVHFILDILYLLAKTGGCGFCEHPQYPVWCAARAPCSIWSLRATKQLCQLRCVSAVSFDQCVLRASIRKPTTILLVRLADFRTAVLDSGKAGRCPHGPGAHERLLGRDSTGQFRTCRGKIYPVLLNWQLGQAVAKFVERTFIHQESCSIDAALPTCFLRFAGQDFVNLDIVQRDYHG